jgi:hypothetical protein
MALKFSTTAEEGRLHGVKILVYSEAGAGKTVLASTAPNPLIISAEAGLLSLRDTDIPVIVVHSIEDLNEAYEWCTKSPEAAQFDTICLDSITEIAEVVLATAKRLAKDPRQAYGEMQEKMTTLVKAFRDIQGKHVYMSAKMEPQKDEMTGIVKYSPSMPGTKLGPQLPYLFDEVFRLGVGKNDEGQFFRYLQTNPDLQYVAKDRSGALGTWEQPNLSEIITKIQGGQNGST